MRILNHSVIQLPLLAAVIGFGGMATVSAQSRHHGSGPSRFGPNSLRPMPDFRRVINSEDIRQYWLRMIPEVQRPSQTSSGYNYAMPFYRQELAEKNCLVDDLQRGVYDERAECEALRHNIRHFRRHGNPRKAEELQTVLMRREAVASGDTEMLNALLLGKLLDSKSDSPGELRELLILQSNRIAGLEKQVEALKNRLIRMEITTAPDRNHRVANNPE